MREIYNEGRVVGLSQWELYLRQTLSTDPNAKVLSEQEWLAASLSSNSSMILKVAANTPAGSHDYVLPEGSDLCGCSVIYGSIFEGAVRLDESGYWATAVTDYGRLVSNTASSHPVTPGQPANVPTKANPEVIPTSYADQCDDYLKITGSLIFQPGTWELDSIPDGRYKLTPDMHERGFIRISVHEKINNDVYILLHGFSFRNLFNGGAGYDHLAELDEPQNGDFLGPSEFPWACKVVLIVTTDMIKEYTRKLRTSWSGTRAEFNALTPEQRSRYNLFGVDDTNYN